MTSSHVVVVGGGLAGLAATVALASHGSRVTLLESRPRWGGRASSFVDQVTGEHIDNCQHVSLGCCTNFRAFCESVGIDDLFRPEPRLWFHGPGRCRPSTFSAAPLPAPFHLLPALARLRYLSTKEKLDIARGLRALAHRKLATDNLRSFAEWLAEQGQSAAVIEKFWHVVLVSALSETVDRIHVAAARKVFVDAFLAHREGWRVWMPTVPLDELYGSRLSDWLVRHGVTARTQAGVKSLHVDQGRVTRVELRSGESYSPDHVVLAVPHFLVASLLPSELAGRPPFNQLARLQSAPISSVHLWFDRPLTSLRHATLVGRLSQWVFNRSLIQNAGPATTSHYYQVVISASRELSQQSPERTIEAVCNDLAEIWPAAATARRLHARLVTEHRAALSMLPGVEQYRPVQQSPVDNLQLAGDWTQTGWPSTMEGAVRSGFLAAENILRHCGTPHSIVRPDQPRSWLSRFLFKL